MSVVTISRQLGSNGTRIAEEVAAQLSAVCVDKEVLAQMAQQEGVSVEMIVQAEERLVSRPVLVSEEMKSLFGAGARKPGSFTDAKSFVTHMGAAIRALADQDNVVFVGRGTQLLLADYPQALHVRITRPWKCGRLVFNRAGGCLTKKWPCGWCARQTTNAMTGFATFSLLSVGGMRGITT